jgi:hypothetical protein
VAAFIALATSAPQNIISQLHEKRETYNLYREVNRDSLHSCHKLLLLVLNCLTICFAYALRSFIQFISFLFNVIQEFTDGDLTCSLSKRGFYLKNTLKNIFTSITILIEYGQQKTCYTERQEIQAITLFIMTKRLEKSAVLSKTEVWKPEKLQSKKIKPTHRKNQYTITLV